MPIPSVGAGFTQQEAVFQYPMRPGTLKHQTENMKSNDGVYGRNISDEDMDRAVWVLRGILIEMHSPSQIGEPLGGTAIFGTTRGEL